MSSRNIKTINREKRKQIPDMARLRDSVNPAFSISPWSQQYNVTKGTEFCPKPSGLRHALALGVCDPDLPLTEQIRTAPPNTRSSP